MKDPKILEITYSVGYEVSPQDPDSPSDSVEKAILIAHVMYEYVGECGMVDVDLATLGTKTLSAASGHTSVSSVTTQELSLTKDQVVEKISEVLREKVKSDSQRLRYESHIKKSLAEAQRTFPVFSRYS